MIQSTVRHVCRISVEELLLQSRENVTSYQKSDLVSRCYLREFEFEFETTELQAFWKRVTPTTTTTTTTPR